jgi:UDP-N-acetylglucosamine transferase subunit ALG13
MEKNQNMLGRCSEKMIFVTVGTHYLGFERLIKKMDNIACKTDEKIIAQIGSTRYKPKNMKYFRFIEEDEKYIEFNKKSRVVVTHAGAGTLLKLLYYKKPIIVVPRLKKYNEHIDNHQLELTEFIHNEGLGKVVYDIEKLEDALKNASFNNNYPQRNNGGLVSFLKKYIENEI